MSYFELDDVSYIKQLITNIANETELKGHFDIAQSIRFSLQNLEREDLSIYIDQDVKTISSRVKEEASGNIMIYTKTAEWFSADRKIILENLQSGKVRDVKCVFADARYPFDPLIKNLEDVGVKVTVYPSSLSSNIMGNEVVFYRKAILNGELIRLAIHIHGKVGKQLAKRLASLYNKKYDLLGQSIPKACEAIRIAVIQIKPIKEDWDYLKECLINSSNLSDVERLLFTLFITGIEDNNWISRARIWEIIKFNDEKINSILQNLEIDLKIIETKRNIDTREIELIKLTSEAFFSIVPRILFDLINDEKFLKQNPKLQNIRYKYGLRWQDVGVGIDGIEVRI